MSVPANRAGRELLVPCSSGGGFLRCRRHINLIVIKKERLMLEFDLRRGRAEPQAVILPDEFTARLSIKRDLRE